MIPILAIHVYVLKDNLIQIYSYKLKMLQIQKVNRQNSTNSYLTKLNVSAQNNSRTKLKCLWHTFI